MPELDNLNPSINNVSNDSISDNAQEDEEYELVEEDVSEAGRQMVENALVSQNDQPAREQDGALYDFVGDILNNANTALRNDLDAEITKATNDCRNQTKQFTGLNDFSSLSNRNIEYLNSKDIDNVHKLLTSNIENDLVINECKNAIIGNKRMNATDLKNAATLLYSMKENHSKRDEDTKDTLSFIEEGKAIDTLELALQAKGVNTELLDNIVNPETNEQYEIASEIILDQMAEKELQNEVDILNAPHDNLKMMKSILGMQDSSNLSEDQLYAINNKNNPDVEVNQFTLEEANFILNGPEFLQKDAVNRAIMHLASQEDTLSKMNPRGRNFNELKRSIDDQKELLLRKGLPLQSLNKMVNAKCIESLAESREKMAKLDPESAEYKAMQASFERTKSTLLLRGLSRERFSELLEAKGGNDFENELNKFNFQMNAKALIKGDYWTNVDNFYTRLAVAFDAENYDKGKPLDADCLKEGANVFKEMGEYARQLAIDGKFEESSKMNEEAAKIGKFLVAKGLTKEELNEIKNADPAEVDKKCDIIMYQVKGRSNSSLTERKSLQVEDQTRKQIVVQEAANVEIVNYAKEMEQFDDVTKVPDIDNPQVEQEENNKQVQEVEKVEDEPNLLQ